MISEDRRFVLSYNGELYNFQQLKRELEDYGHKFRSHSDTEVILRSFIQWGAGSVDRFSGMFAFAIWCPADGNLFLARDPLGMKPLYYTVLPRNQGFVFASEIKAFLALPDFQPKANRSALLQFLEFGYTYDAEETSLEGVKKLPPGSRLWVTDGVPARPEPYFAPPSPRPVDHLSLQEREEELHDTLSEVVGQHLVADVSVGLLLSGGLDSSVTAALAARVGKITTISTGFADSTIDERPHARTVAEFIGSDHHEVIIRPTEVREGLENVVWYFDDLFADWGTVSTRLMYQKCREIGIKVVLVGEGSDELFGGYPIFDAAIRLRGPSTWKLFHLYRRYAGRRYGSQFSRFASIMRGYLDQTNGNMFEGVRLFESRNQLPNNYVMKVDKASMSVSVEARAPFLDRRLAELAYRTPTSFLWDRGGNKLLLRSMASRFKLLPPEILWRPKFGTAIPASWMDESPNFRKYAEHVVLEKEGWTDTLGLRSAMTDYFVGKKLGYSFPRSISIFSNLAWRLLLLNLWSRRYAGT
jgi:asparagine synthase (glutamine-hydrolysing)